MVPPFEATVEINSSDELSLFSHNLMDPITVKKTTLLAKDLINNESPLLIANSDQYLDQKFHF